MRTLGAACQRPFRVVKSHAVQVFCTGAIEFDPLHIRLKSVVDILLQLKHVILLESFIILACSSGEQKMHKLISFLDKNLESFYLDFSRAMCLNVAKINYNSFE